MRNFTNRRNHAAGKNVPPHESAIANITIFDETAIGRACDIDFSPGKYIRVCTAEDLIVSKMLSTRAKDRGDGEPVVQKQVDALKNAYIENWPAQFKEALADSTQIPDFRKIRTG